ncbi:hypothetical protein Tco_0250341 [Tanacetum coccineum]
MKGVVEQTKGAAQQGINKTHFPHPVVAPVNCLSKKKDGSFPGCALTIGNSTKPGRGTNPLSATRIDDLFDQLQRVEYLLDKRFEPYRGQVITPTKGYEKEDIFRRLLSELV